MDINELRNTCMKFADEGYYEPLIDMLRNPNDTPNRVEREFLADILEGKIKVKRGRPVLEKSIQLRMAISSEYFTLVQVDGVTKGKAVQSLAKQYGISDRMIRTHLKKAKECVHCEFQNVYLPLLHKLNYFN